jgi:hypothetical protein
MTTGVKVGAPALALLALHAALARAAAPTGLLCDYQRSPALGVRGAGGDAPRFSWIVPPCAGTPDAAQAAFAVVVTSEGAPVWASGRVEGGDRHPGAFNGVRGWRSAERSDGNDR